MSNLLEVKNLSKLYKDFKLDNINFNLPAGSVIGLIGANGAGKSTIIKCILNMVSRDSGEINIMETSIDDKNFSSIKKYVGVVFDEVGIPEHFNVKQVGKIMSNVFVNWDQEKFSAYIEKFKLPKKKEFKEFSRGMKMKLGIAIALSHNAKLLLLDEATSGLDPLIRSEILDIFADFVKDGNHSILISSHIVSDLEKICDYLLFIHNGKLILFDKKQDLLDNYKLILCPAENLKEIPSDSILGQRNTSWGVEAVIHKESVPANVQVKNLNIEELFLFLAKEE